LTSLSVSNNPSISVSDIASIFGSSLTELDVSGMELDGLSWLYEVDSGSDGSGSDGSGSGSVSILFPMLEYLDVSDNNISDPSPLLSLSSTLTTLELSGNNISGMDNMEEVELFMSHFPLLTSDESTIFAGNEPLCDDDSI
ncbi:hypothetical protein ADUPG1_004484, partial [Aduncisulcus paluster]